MTAMQHICTWQATEDERFQVCGDDECPTWRWSPAYSEGAAIEAHRSCQNAPRTPIQPICGPNGSEVTNRTTATETGAA